MSAEAASAARDPDMAVTSAAAGDAVPPRPAFAQDWRRIGRMGAVAVLGQFFISLSNMPVRLDGRAIIEGLLSLGYLSLVIVPLAIGHRVGQQVRREGVRYHAAGAHEIVGGAAAGALAGGGLSLLAILLANFDLREPLVNWSPILAELLGFGRGTAFAVLIWLVIGAGVGAAAGLARVLCPVARRVLWTMVLAVFGAAVLEALVEDLAEGLGIEPLTDWFYASRGGLTPIGALVLAGGSGVLAFVARGRVRQARTRIDQLEGSARQRANMMLIAGTGALLVVLPIFAGKLTNELLANVGYSTPTKIGRASCRS